jgi:hypothetical protein
LEFIFTTSSIGIIALRKGLLGDERIRINSSLRLVLHMLFFMDVKYRVVLSLVNPEER